jgi:hypothetical protein
VIIKPFISMEYDQELETVVISRVLGGMIYIEVQSIGGLLGRINNTKGSRKSIFLVSTLLAMFF